MQRIRRPRMVDRTDNSVAVDARAEPKAGADERQQENDRRNAAESIGARAHRLADFHRCVGSARQYQHGKTHEPGEQRKGMQETEEPSGGGRPLQGIEAKWQAEEKIAECYPEEQG